MQGPSTSLQCEETHIEHVIHNFFEHLSKFKFERSLTYIEDVRRTPLNDEWQTLLALLSQFASAESQYFALSFVSSKFSFRKEVQLKDTYLQTNSELEKYLDECELEPKVANINFLIVFLRQFIAVVTTRIKLIEFYGFLSVYSWRTFGEEALAKLARINQDLDYISKNVIKFGQFKNMCTEIAILQRLLKTQEDLLNMIDTVLQIKSLQEDLSTWFECVNTQDSQTKRSFFSFSLGGSKGKVTSKFALLYWIHSFLSFLISKVNLYYYLTLTNYLSPGESRSILSARQTSFLHQLILFGRKTNVQLTTLILNRMDLTEPFFDFGYHKMLKKYSPEYCKSVTGIKGHFPALVYFGQGNSFERYHPSITSLIQELCLQGKQSDKIKFLYDFRADETFFITHVEKRVYLAVVFDKKVGEKDQIVQNFFNEILLSLRGAHLLHELKFGFK